MDLTSNDISLLVDDTGNVQGRSQLFAQSTPQGSFDESLLNLNVSSISVNVSRQTRSKQPQFKVPVSKPKKKTNFICTYCLKGYICGRSYKNHLLNHRVQDAAARFPDKETIIDNLKEISFECLQQVAAAPCAGKLGAKFKALTDALLTKKDGPEWEDFSLTICNELLDCAVGEKFLLPSKLVASLLSQVETITSNKTLCTYVIELLPYNSEFEKSVLLNFSLEFVLVLAKEVLKFISKTLRDKNPVVVRNVQQLDKEDLEVIYYIGGSIMRGYLRIAKRNKASVMWSSIYAAIQGKILRPKPEQDSEEYQVTAWTQSVDRGGLLYVTDQCHSFADLAQVVFKCQKSDGSINYEEVITIVTNSSLAVLWDSIIYDSLPERLSLSLMNDVVKSFCKTCGRGLAKKRLNALRGRPVVSMPTRHLVASRKK